MKIVTVSQQFTTNSMRGTVKHQYHLLKNLAKRGHECVVYTTTVGADSPEEMIDGITVRRYGPLLSYGHYIITPKMLEDLISDKADVIHVRSYRNFQTDIGAVVSKLRGTPLVLTTHGSLILYQTLSKSWIETFPNRIYDLLTFKFSIHAATRVVVTSWPEAQEAIEFGIPKRKIAFIPHGVEIPPDALAKSKKAPEGRALLFVGRLTPQRNLEFLLQAFALVIKEKPEVELLIIGDELPSRYVPSEVGYKAKLLGLCKELNILNKVHFAGEIHGDKLWDAYRSCDAFVYTSLYDNFGHALAEATTFGKPIISTPVGIAPDLIGRNEGGILVKHNDVHGLKDALLRILSDDELYRSMQNTIEKRAKKYSLDAMVERYEKLFKDLANPS